MFINFYYFFIILPKSIPGWLTWGWYCVFLVFSGPGSMRVHCHGTQHLASNSWFCRHVLQLSNSFHDTCAPWLANSFMLVHTCAPAVQQLPYHMHMPAAKQLCMVNMFMVHVMAQSQTVTQPTQTSSRRLQMSTSTAMNIIQMLNSVSDSQPAAVVDSGGDVQAVKGLL